MRTVKILNLYGEALDLNGDGKNITAFEKRIALSVLVFTPLYLGL